MQDERWSLSRSANFDPAAGGDAEPEVFLADCLEEDWERIARYCTRRRFRAGEIVVRAGDIDRSLAIVTTGGLDYIVTDGAGAERVANRVDAPSVIGEVAFFDAGPRSGTLRARTDGELLRLGFAEFESLAATSPSLARMILLDAGRILAARLRRASRAAGEPGW